MRETKNVYTFSTFVKKFFNFHREKEKSIIDQMKTVTSERCNTHTMYHLAKSIISKVIKNIQ